MENLEGGPIRWEDADNRPVLTLPQIRRIMRDVILGLEYRASLISLVVRVTSAPLS